MPNRWTGTVEDRLANMDKAGRRCDGNNRHCTRSAVEKYKLLRADGNGIAVDGAVEEWKKCCGYHRAQFLENGMWKVLANIQLDTLPPLPPGKRPPGGRPGRGDS
jgi:hypothetical protein